jgi:hypothetical protein
MFVYKCLLPPGDNPIAVNKCVKCRLETKYSFGKTYEGILFRMSVGEILAVMPKVRMIISKYIISVDRHVALAFSGDYKTPSSNYNNLCQFLHLAFQLRYLRPTCLSQQLVPECDASSCCCYIYKVWPAIQVAVYTC